MDKAEGDSVSAATLNQSGFLRCEATRVGEDTTLAQIIRMVSDAAATKAPIAKIADTVSGVFVPDRHLHCGPDHHCLAAAGQGRSAMRWPAASRCWSSAAPVRWVWQRLSPSWWATVWAPKTASCSKPPLRWKLQAGTQIVALDKTGTITSGEPRVTDILPAGRFRE